MSEEKWTEARAREICRPGRIIPLSGKTHHEPFWEEFLQAKGYLTRVTFCAMFDDSGAPMMPYCEIDADVETVVKQLTKKR